MKDPVLDRVVSELEVLEGKKLVAYQDQGGKWTVGYGSTGPGIEAGTVWTEAEAKERLQSDAEKTLQGVKEMVRVPATNGQLVALTLFAYNVGLHNLQRSGLLKELNHGNIKGAAEHFLLWNKIGSYVSKGLTTRRTLEQGIFLS